MRCLCCCCRLRQFDGTLQSHTPMLLAEAGARRLYQQVGMIIVRLTSVQTQRTGLNRV
jgi:hypothetical protein